MPTLNSSFKVFLSNIEPSEEVRAYAQEAHKPVRDYLSTDETFGEFFENSFLYGSYARHTAVGDIRDVDIVVLTNFDPDNEDHAPKKVLRKLKKALTTYYEDASNTAYNRKSIQVNDPLPDYPEVKMTLDVIPSIALDGNESPLLVPDRQDGIWVPSHPKGHLSYTSKLNGDDCGQGMYVPLVKIMKHWWAYNAPRKKAKPKGFWVETLTGEHFDPNKDTYADHFIAVLESIANKYFYYKWMSDPPLLADPALPNDTLTTSMTLEEFQTFMDVVNDSLELAYQAYEADKYEGSEIWNTLLGDEFPITERRVTEKSLQESFTDEYYSRQERFLFRDFGIRRVKNGYTFEIDCTVKQDGFRDFRLRNTRKPLKKGCQLEFFVRRSDIPVNYRIMWKVKNTGDEAKSVGQLRGEVTLDKGNRAKKETTRYSGTHYVECYAIADDNICIAKDRLYVPIL